MPIYQFFNKKLDEYRDVYFGMNDAKVYRGEPGEDDTEWERVYTLPQLATEGIKVNPWDKKAFVEKTSKGGTLGDIWDRSKELSLKRAAENGGVDPVSRDSKKKRDQEMQKAREANRRALAAEKKKKVK